MTATMEVKETAQDDLTREDLADLVAWCKDLHALIAAERWPAAQRLVAETRERAETLVAQYPGVVTLMADLDDIARKLRTRALVATWLTGVK